MRFPLTLRSLVLTWLACVGLAFLAFYAVLASAPEDTAVNVSASLTANGKTTQVNLPIWQRNEPAGFYYLSFETSAFPADKFSGLFRVIADDCLESMVINNAVVDIAAPIEGNRCDHRYGMVLDLSSYLQEGTNTFWVSTRNKGGISTFSMTAGRTNMVEAVGRLLIAIVFFPPLGLLVFLGWKNLHLEVLEKVFLCVANIVFLVWILNTKAEWFSYDYDGHMQYINYIVDYWRWPNPTHGWIYYHPPLFYSLAAIPQYILQHTFPTISDNGPLRVFGWLGINGFLLAGMLLVRRQMLTMGWRILALALLCLWPANIMLSGRIDNATLLYPLAAWSFLMLLRWHDGGQRKHMVWCLVLFGFALAARTNIIILAPVIALAILLHVRNWSNYIRPLWHYSILLACAVVVAGASVNTGRILYYRITENTNQAFIVGNQNKTAQRLFVETKAPQFLTFDVANYLSMPFLHQWPTPSNNFWHIMIKTSVLGEFGFSNQLLGYMVSACVLFMWAWVLVPLLFYRIQDFKLNILHITFILVAIIALAINRMIVPAWPCTDFRFIYNILPSFVLIYIRHTRFVVRRGYLMLSALCVGCGVALPILGIWLYLGQVL